MQTLKMSVLFCWIVVFSCAQKPTANAEKLQWMTLDDVTGNLKKEKRPVLIDLYYRLVRMV